MRRQSRLRRGVLAMGVLAGALGATLGFYLATSGSITSGITLPANSSGFKPGKLATVTPFTVSITRSNGGARLTAGVALARITTSYAYVNQLRVLMVWTNARTGTVLLNGANDQISVGLYRAVHVGTCSGTTKTKVIDPHLNLKTPTTTVTYCVHVLTNTRDHSGNGLTLTTGKFLVAEDRPTALLIPKTLPSGTTLAACATHRNSTTGTITVGGTLRAYTTASAWCRSTATNTGVRTLFLVASITNGSNGAKGQQSNLSKLTFYVHTF